MGVVGGGGGGSSLVRAMTGHSEVVWGVGTHGCRVWWAGLAYWHGRMVRWSFGDI